MGYENAYEYEGSKQDWMEAGYPTESSCKRVAVASLFGRLLSVAPERCPSWPKERDWKSRRRC
jgi:hypothetical protein